MLRRHVMQQLDFTHTDNIKARLVMDILQLICAFFVELLSHGESLCAFFSRALEIQQNPYSCIMNFWLELIFKSWIQWSKHNQSTSGCSKH